MLIDFFNLQYVAKPDRGQELEKAIQELQGEFSICLHSP